jgi:hypothetical protein
MTKGILFQGSTAEIVFAEGQSESRTEGFTKAQKVHLVDSLLQMCF